MPYALSRVSDTWRPDIKVTRQDFRDLGSLLAINTGQWTRKSVGYLVRELMRATVVDEGWIPADVVTMGSRVEYRQAGKESTQIVTLSYPAERELFRDAISILDSGRRSSYWAFGWAVHLLRPSGWNLSHD